MATRALEVSKTMQMLCEIELRRACLIVILALYSTWNGLQENVLYERRADGNQLYVDQLDD